LGGENGILNTTEMYDPLTRKWKSMNSMSYRRYAHSATLLKNGKVLVIGGQDDDGYSQRCRICR
jgi:N-acetylneuraminic acid mutarotase